MIECIACGKQYQSYFTHCPHCNTKNVSMEVNKNSDRSVPKGFTSSLEVIAKRNIRLGQAFSNIFLIIRKNGRDPFSIENDEFMKYVDKYLKLID